MALIIDSAKKVSVDTVPVTIDTACKTFIISNTSSSATVYIAEGSDGSVASAENGFALLPGQILPVAVSADELSLVATAASDVYIMFGRED